MSISSKKQKKRFKILAHRSIYRARLFELKAVRMRAPDGHEFQHEVIFHPGAAVIVPVLEGERFVLVKQYRTAAKRIILEFPAGTLETGESPLSCAKREIIEETGFHARRWRKLVSFFPAPGISTEFMHIYLATDLIPKPMALDRDEFIERYIVSFPRLKKLIKHGAIVDAKTMIGFFSYCQQQKKRL